MSARATSLPKLLSLLPSDGRGALVRPLSAPGVVYRITRTKLKFTPRSETENGTSAGVGTAEETGELSVSGRAWGLKFNNGKSPPPLDVSHSHPYPRVKGSITDLSVGRFLPHTKSTLPTTKPDGLLRGINKSKWIQVDETALDQTTRQAISTKAAELARGS